MVPTMAGNKPEFTALLEGMSVSSVLIEVPSRFNQATASDRTLYSSASSINKATKTAATHTA